ncbi:MAG: hypothetical protein ACW9WZ_06770 [Nitrosopumilus sp.]
MKKYFFLVFVLVLVAFPSVYAHKLISHDDSHRDLDSALQIPDHKISWAIYENLGENEAKFYTFYAKEGDSLYTSIVIPKISGLEDYSPTIFLVKPEMNSDDTQNNDSLQNLGRFAYEGNYPGYEFYEPFGQVTYWERQEVSFEIPSDGNYFIIVSDEKNQSGKYSLAVGTIEDFSGSDFVTILPKAWFDTKIFVNDYVSLAIFFSILGGILFLIGLGIKRKIRKN